MAGGSDASFSQIKLSFLYVLPESGSQKGFRELLAGDVQCKNIQNLKNLTDKV